jgi:hypothetical protein
VHPSRAALRDPGDRREHPAGSRQHDDEREQYHERNGPESAAHNA